MARILVVDDDPHVRAVAADTLTLSGHKVDTAQDGVDALYLLKQHAYDIIMSDLRMPILDLYGAGPGGPTLAVAFNGEKSVHAP